MNNELNEYKPDEALIKETIQRLISIFDEYGLQLVCNSPPNMAYRELVDQLTPFFKDLWNNKKSQLMLILYRIDISERLIQQTTRNFPQMHIYEVLAHLVIKRELQKAITRRHFKQ